MKPLLIGFLAAALSLGAAATPVGRRFEAVGEDLRFRYRRMPPTSDNIVHVDIDDASIARIGRWPWSRTVQARILRTLSDLGAVAIGMDVEYLEHARPELLSEADLRERLGRGPIEMEDLLVDPDADLAAAIREAGCVYLAYHYDAYREAAEGTPEDRMLRLLRGDLTSSAADLAAHLGVPETRVREGFEFTRRRAIRERLAGAAASGTLASDDALVGMLLSGAGGADPGPLRLLVASEVERFRTAALLGEACPLAGRYPAPEDESSILVPPILSLAAAARGAGFVDIRPDPLDGTLRRVRPLHALDGRLYPNLATRIWMDLAGATLAEARLEPGGRLVLPCVDGEVAVPVDSHGRVTISWADLGGGDEAYWESHLGPHLPCSALYDLWEMRELVVGGVSGMEEYGRVASREWIAALSDRRAALGDAVRAGDGPGRDAAVAGLRALREETPALCDALRAQLKEIPGQLRPEMRSAAEAHVAAGLERVDALERIARRTQDLDDRLRARVGGRICLLGETYSGGTDFKPTPTRAAMPGVAAHSNLLDMLQRRRFVRRPGPWVGGGLAVAMGLLAAWVASRGHVAAVGARLMLYGAAYVGALALAFSAWGWMGPMVAPLLSGALGYTGVTVYRELTSEKDRRRLRKMFGLYLSPAVIAEIERNPRKLNLGGEERVITSFFSDLKSFTRIAEGMSSTALVEMLRGYFDRMTGVVLSEDGTLDKYYGDAIVAFWGAPISQADHALRAVRAALESQRVLDLLRREMTGRGEPALFMRVGLNSGRAVVGNVGATEHRNYTALGDTVNLASRLEGANKVFGTGILIGQETWLAVRHAIACRRVGRVVVLGRTEPVGVYEPLGPEEGLSPADRAWLAVYHGALDLYLKGDLPAALERFEESLRLREEDGPSVYYRDACRWRADLPVPEGWDGRIVLDEK